MHHYVGILQIRSQIFRNMVLIIEVLCLGKENRYLHVICHDSVASHTGKFDGGLNLTN